MNTIRKLFELINRILDGAIALTDTTINWTDQIVIESELAIMAVKQERATRIAELNIDEEDLPPILQSIFTKPKQLINQPT